jgi:hypothetical protein
MRKKSPNAVGSKFMGSFIGKNYSMEAEPFPNVLAYVI